MWGESTKCYFTELCLCMIRLFRKTETYKFINLGRGEWIDVTTGLRISFINLHKNVA